MDVSVKTLDGKAAGKAALDDAIFGIEDIRSDVLHRTVRWQLAKRQAGTHKTQSRSEVSVTTKKFIRQKGSGGARHGSRNAPIFVGGGVAHGPRVRSHAHGLPKANRKLALAHALSSKAKDGTLIVLDDAKLDAPKTKDLRGKLAGLGIENALIIGGVSVDENFAKAARNIPNVDVLPVIGLNVYDVMRRKTLVLTKDAVDGISQRFEGKLQGASPFSKDNFIDDIQLVDGIGPKTAKALRAAGAGTLTGYVALSDADRNAALEKVGKVEKANTEDWLGQCKEMIAGEPPRSKVDKEYAARLLAKRAKEAK
jgi:large subunit ribosomal protein L4